MEKKKIIDIIKSIDDDISIQINLIRKTIKRDSNTFAADMAMHQTLVAVSNDIQEKLLLKLEDEEINSKLTPNN